MMATPIKLILEGGGIKAVAHIGVISVLERSNFKISSCAGASAGALVGACVAAGYSAKEMKEILFKTRWSDFLDGPKSTWKQILYHPFTWGIHPGRLFSKWLKEILLAKGVQNFGDVQGKLHVAIADISFKRMVVLPDDLEKYGLDLSYPIYKAIRASISIPGIFRPVVMRMPFGPVYWVDGGLISNFPSWVFSNYRKQTIGVILEEEGSESYERISGVMSYYRNIVVTKIGPARDVAGVRIPIIKVPVGQIRATDFDLTQDQFLWLYHQGVRATEKFLRSKAAARIVNEGVRQPLEEDRRRGRAGGHQRNLGEPKRS